MILSQTPIFNMLWRFSVSQVYRSGVFSTSLSLPSIRERANGVPTPNRLFVTVLAVKAPKVTQISLNDRWRWRKNVAIGYCQSTQQELSSCWDGRPFGRHRHRPKIGGCWCSFMRGWEESWAPIEHNEAWAEAYLRSKWHIDPSSRLVTIVMGRKVGDCGPF